MTQVQTKNRATSDEAARKDVLKRIDDEGVEFVLLWFNDIEGHLKSFAVTPGEVQGALDDGMGFDGSSITGFNAIEESDMVAMTTMDAATELRQETVRALESMGIPIEYVHHEVGPSQHEIDMRFAPALQMADHTLTYRLIVKEIAKKAGFHATFMPKPIFGENGSGMHTHQSLFKDGRN